MLRLFHEVLGEASTEVYNVECGQRVKRRGVAYLGEQGICGFDGHGGNEERKRGRRKTLGFL